MSTKTELIQSLKKVFSPGKYNQLMGQCSNTITEIYLLFGKVKYLFNLLNDIMKYMIISIDDEKYQEIKDKHVLFPDNEDKLICIVSMYHKAFSPDINEILYEIVNYPKFADLQAISNIPHELVSSVVDDTVEHEALQRDFDEFSTMIKILSVDVLKIGIDFSSSIIEDEKNNITENNDSSDIDSSVNDIQQLVI
jgi:hypothetical protein